jgi:hypothetical protein
VVSRLDGALTEVFSEKGKQTVLYYMNSKYGLSLEQATKDPARLEKSMTEMLGQVGWMVVKRAILEEFWERRIEINETQLVERASLLDAFKFGRFFNVGAFVGPR